MLRPLRVSDFGLSFEIFSHNTSDRLPRFLVVADRDVQHARNARSEVTEECISRNAGYGRKRIYRCQNDSAGAVFAFAACILNSFFDCRDRVCDRKLGNFRFFV